MMLLECFWIPCVDGAHGNWGVWGLRVSAWSVLGIVAGSWLDVHSPIPGDPNGPFRLVGGTSLSNATQSTKRSISTSSRLFRATSL